MTDLRAENARLVGFYDAYPYDQPAQPALEPRALMGIGALHGLTAPMGDVLDLGCGGGQQLARAGQQMSGRLLGIDLSEDHCAKARERCAPFGARAEIRRADFLDLTPEKLGRFDLIYLMGTLYVLPPDVRRHAVALAAQCLNPGGAVILSHYSGLVTTARAYVQELVRAMVIATDPRDAVAEARVRLEDMARRLNASNTPSLALSVVQATLQVDDTSLYHEMFNPGFGAISAAWLDREFSVHGAGFAQRLDPARYGFLPDSRERALAADIEDLNGGGYRLSLFGNGVKPADMHAPQLVWTCEWRRQDRENFRHPSGNSIRIPPGPAAAIIDQLAQGPARLADIAAAIPGANPAAVEQEMRNMWAARFITPLRMGA